MARQNFLFQVAIMLIFSAVTTMSTPILDSDKNPLEVGSEYYVVPAVTGMNYGGLNLSPKEGTTCPNYVAQYTSDKKRGRPVSFSIPSNPSQKTITDDTYVTITFKMNYVNQCKNTGEWQIILDPTRNFVIKVGEKNYINHPSLFKLGRIKGSDPTVNRIYHCFIDECEQVTAGKPGVPGLRLLRFVSTEQNVPFEGFVFKKATSEEQNYYSY